MNKAKVLEELIERYRRNHKDSEAFFKRAAKNQIRGGSHNLRLFSPFPFYDIKANGSTITDVDGNTYVDFWQGHFANVLGHNPPCVMEALSAHLKKEQGMITGFPGTHQRHLAELLLNRIPADKIRFTTSGALATMYAIMLAKAFTGRDIVMKIGGGWHGAQPFGLKGVIAYDGSLSRIESAGLPSGMDTEVITTRFNSMEDLENKFRNFGDRTACLIMELMVGSGGLIFGQPEYVDKARELTNRYGTLLIVDEVISGFRFHAGGLQSLYNLKPELSVFGKSIGGGMPVSAVIGREDIMSLIEPGTPADRMVKFDGGTFSAHPASMVAGEAFIQHLIEHEKDIYPKIGRLGAKVRKEIENIFSSSGFNVVCTGDGGGTAKNSSMIGVHFLNQKVDSITSPDQAWNPEIIDFELREKIFKLAMMEEGFYTFHGYGSISSAHTEAEIQSSLEAVEKIVQKWSP